MIVTIPTSWEDISVEQYCELQQYELNTKIIFDLLLHFKGVKIKIDTESFDKLIIVLSILLKVEESFIESLNVKNLNEILLKLKWITPLKAKQSTIDFNKITVGKFVDLETIIENGLNNNFIKFTDKMFDVQTWDMPITKVYSEVTEYLNWRKNLFKNFEGLFENTEEEDLQDVGIGSKELQVSTFNRKWNWFGFIHRLANGDIFKMEDVSEINIIFAFNFLSYEKEKTFIKQN